MATFDIRNLEIFWKVNLVPTVINYEYKSGLQSVEIVDTQGKPYQRLLTHRVNPTKVHSFKE